MDNFIYSINTKIYFGKDEENKTGQLIKKFNPHKVLIHYGSDRIVKNGFLKKITDQLESEEIKYVTLGGVVPNPTLSLVRKGIEICSKEKVDFILAIGGGSVMDSAKDIANGAANLDVDVWDFTLGRVKPKKSLNKAAILTLSASGSEMSDSCVVTNEETKDKRGYNSPFNRFDFAIENPVLTFSVDKYQTACGAVDIAMHTIERYFCPGEHTEVTDEIAIAIIKSTNEASKICLKDPCNYDARANMMWASSLAHNGLTGLGRKFQLVVHQFELELSGLYPEIAHGAGLAALWCSWARYVYKYNEPRWHKYVKEIWGEDDILKGIQKQEDFYKSIGMPISLKEFNIKEEDLELLSLKVTRNKTRTLIGDKPLDYDDVLAIYKLAFIK